MLIIAIVTIAIAAFYCYGNYTPLLRQTASELYMVIVSR